MSGNSVIQIESEFKSLIPPLSKEEYQQLEANILAEGCRDALVVWHPLEHECILLDGHNRYEICKKHGIDFDITPVDCFDRQDALNWIINNQLGRRNLHPDQASYLRGKRYNGEKQAQGGTGANQHVQSSQNDNSAKTHERLAEEYKVSPATITRDGQYAAATFTPTRPATCTAAVAGRRTGRGFPAAGVR